MQHQSKHSALQLLKSSGLPVGSVIDVGVNRDTPDLREIYADVPHLLIEPVSEYHPAIHEAYHGLDYRLIDAAASSENGILHLQDVGHDPLTGIVSHVAPVESSGAGIRTVRAVTLDNLLAEEDMPAPYLLKIDVDGQETSVMRGASTTMRRCCGLIIEMTMKYMAERVELAYAHGMRLWNIVDVAYYADCLYQLDAIFLPEWVLDELPTIDPYWHFINKEFDPSKWHSI